MYFKTLSAAVLLTAAILVQAQVEVEDRSPAHASVPPPISTPPPSNASQSAELYYQLQLLQQEVLQLKGKVEVQEHELKRLKQQRLDDYLDLDRRLSALGQVGASPRSSATGTAATATSTAANTSSPGSEIQHYRAAIDLVLKKQQYDEAVVELKEHLKRYPQGRYAANATYWLGEIYLLKDDLEQSRQWFVQLISDFPDDRKVPDGKFKLGKVYHLMGNEEQARTLLEEVAASKSDAARLARTYLAEHFTS
ncbi:tol-pal system protein YbgF [Alteromonadaceae bacterium Bs31]|nr:tol-pal system protein YbgF [Alteromonadaceae bacterium Bs31]